MARKKSEKQINVSKLTRSALTRLLNGSSYAALRKQAGGKGQITTQQTVGNWISQGGCPINPDGKTLNIIDLTAWLAADRKDGGATGTKNGGPKDDEFQALQKDLMRSQISANNANAEYRAVKTELEDYKRRVQNGELIESEEVEQGRVERARYIRSMIETLPNFAGRVQGKHLAEARAELTEVAREICLLVAGEDDGSN
jgi:hypothetical protein